MKSPFYLPLTLRSGATSSATIAAFVTTLPLVPETGNPVAVLTEDAGAQVQGLYVFDGLTWRYTLPMTEVAAIIIKGDALEVYTSVTSEVTLPAITVSYKNGQLQAVDTLAIGAGPYAVVTPSTSPYVSTQVFNGSDTAVALKVQNSAELVEVVAAAPAAALDFYVASGATQLHTVAAANDWTINFAWSADTTLDAAMAVGDAITVQLLTTQGATAYYPTAFSVDDVVVVPDWVGGTAPSAGTINSVEGYKFTIIKTAADTYTILASMVNYK